MKKLNVVFIPLLFFKVVWAAPTTSINLMWINNKLDEKQEFICPEKQEKTFFDSIVGWAEKNVKDEIPVNVWYDGKTTTNAAVINTFDQLQNSEFFKFINLKNIRNLNIVKDNEKIFECPIPVYFRTDLLRAIVAWEEMEKAEKGSISFYSDINVPTHRLKDLLNEKAMDKLKAKGILMPTKGGSDFENKVQILGNENSNLLKAFKKVLIDINIARANYALDKGGYYGKKEFPYAGLNEVVFYSYDWMYLYALLIEGKIELSAIQQFGGEKLGLSFLEVEDGDVIGMEKAMRITDNPEISPYNKVSTILKKLDLGVPLIKIDYPHISYNYNISCN